MSISRFLRCITALCISFAMIPIIPVMAQEVTIYMSPAGNDLNNASKEAPIKSFEKAIEISEKVGKPCKVILNDGVYRLENAVIFEEKSDIQFIAQNKGKVKITAATELDGNNFKKVTDKDVLSIIPEAARDDIYMLDLAVSGINDYGSMVRVERHKMQTPSSSLLLVDGKMMTVAEWPNKAFTKIKNTGSTDVGYKFEIEENRPLRWKTAKEMYAYGNFNFEWADETFTIINMNAEESYFETTATTVHGIKDGGQVRFINLLEELDIPGEWYLDRNEGVVYIYPFNSPENSAIDLVTTQKPLF